MHDALFDHCIRLRPDAYDEVITRPTEESERCALAIRMIITPQSRSAELDGVAQRSAAFITACGTTGYAAGWLQWASEFLRCLLSPPLAR